MSVAKLLLSGLLVASGVILGAFTLHAALAPEWEVQATPAVRSLPLETLRDPDRPAASDVPDNWAPRLTRTQEPKPAPGADPKAAEARKKLAEKKKKPKQEEPQTVFSWLAGLLAK